MTSTDASTSILKKRFEAKGADDQTYEVHVYVKTAAIGAEEHRAPIEKIDTVCLADGSEVRVLGKGRYEIVASGMTLTSTAADAI